MFSFRSWTESCGLPEIAARQAGLARHMSERLNALAERVFVQAEAATTPEAVQAAALTVEKLYCGVRMCMAFESRVAREHRRTLREDEAQALKDHQADRALRIERVKQAHSAAFITEYEAECETSRDSEEDLRTPVRHLAAVGEAVTGAESAANSKWGSSG